MNQELMFWGKVIRNAFILAGLYFVSVFAAGDISWEICKPVLIFFGTYIFTELARHYKLQPATTKKVNMTTMIF